MTDFKNVNFDGLSIPEKIGKINTLIADFSPERKIDVCPECRKKTGDFKEYSPFLEDTAICSVCFVTNDVINYSIIELVEKSKLDVNDFYNYIVQSTPHKTVFNGKRTSLTDQEKDAMQKKMEAIEIEKRKLNLDKLHAADNFSVKKKSFNFNPFALLKREN